MSVLQFPNTMYIKVLNDQYEILGAFTAVDNLELVYITLSCLTTGTRVGSERFRLHLYSRQVVEQFTDPLISSDWINLSNLGSNKYGRLRFDFAQFPINGATTYQMVIESANYTRTATFYVAAKLDWPDDVYTATDQSVRGAQVRIIGYVSP